MSNTPWLALTGFLVAIWAVPCALPARAGPRVIRVTAPRAALVDLARVGANEDSRCLRPVAGGGTAGGITSDHLGIAQVAANVQRASRAHSFWSAIRVLAPNVTRQKAPANERVARYGALPARGHERPAGWDDALHGPWALYGPNWSRFRDAMVERLRDGFEAPCACQPIAWGCTPIYKPGCDDDRIARSRGLVPCMCGERNRFWARPSSTIPAHVAAQRPR